MKLVCVAEKNLNGDLYKLLISYPEIKLFLTNSELDECNLPVVNNPNQMSTIDQVLYYSEVLRIFDCFDIEDKIKITSIDKVFRTTPIPPANRNDLRNAALLAKIIDLIQSDNPSHEKIVKSLEKLVQPLLEIENRRLGLLNWLGGINDPFILGDNNDAFLTLNVAPLRLLVLILTINGYSKKGRKQLCAEHNYGLYSLRAFSFVDLVREMFVSAKEHMNSVTREDLDKHKKFIPVRNQPVIYIKDTNGFAPKEILVPKEEHKPVKQDISVDLEGFTPLRDTKRQKVQIHESIAQIPAYQPKPLPAQSASPRPN